MSEQAVAWPAHVVVALDGSALAETVLPLVQTIARAVGARITLLHVLERDAPARVHGQPHLTTAADAERYLRTLAARLQAHELEVRVHVHSVPEPDIAAGIAVHASELGGDLLVLAAHGHGGVRAWLLGRVPEQVTARARCPVLIAPAPTTRDLTCVGRILLPLDQTSESQAAVPHARILATALGATVVLITVVPTPGTIPGDTSPTAVFLPHTTASLLDWAEEQARDALNDLARALDAAGVKVVTEIRRGEPARELLQAIAEHEVDLVVMATHARAGLAGLSAGSVAARVVAAASCPLLLVPLPR